TEVTIVNGCDSITPILNLTSISCARPVGGVNELPGQIMARVSEYSSQPSSTEYLSTGTKFAPFE
ncbi:unnamed protein product, partial [Rotaria sp. Silwood1]